MSLRAVILLLAGLNGLAGVAFAALASHAAGGTAVMTGAMMQLIHALAAIAAIGVVPGALGKVAALTFLGGTMLFAAGVYASGLGGVSLSPVAPIGGIALMAGWLLLAGTAIRTGRN